MLGDAKSIRYEIPDICGNDIEKVDLPTASIGTCKGAKACGYREVDLADGWCVRHWDRGHWDGYLLQGNRYRANGDRATEDLVKADEYERAIQAYSEAIRLDPKYIPGYFNRANVYSKLEQYERAIEDYTETINLDPKLYEACFHRGLSYQKLGKQELANHDFAKAKELKEKSEPLRVNPAP